MAADFTAADLRRLADMLDALTEASTRTGVTVTSYTDDNVTVNDHVIRLDWKDGEQPGHYTVEWPDYSM